MATSQAIYTWQKGDTRWKVAGRLMAQAGYVSATALADDIARANLPANVPTGIRGIVDWQDGIVVGMQIIIPHAS